eukprot:768711-Hanusia_phi.AAC.4
MVDVISISCLECDKRPCYNLPDQNKPLYCKAHKKDNMVDVINKKCLECDNVSVYNLPDQTIPIYCKAHKQPNMVDVISKKCISTGCYKFACYNYDGQTSPTHCNEHKLPNMFLTCSKKCKSEWCHTRVYKNKNQGFCIYCFIHLFPDKSVARNYKTKETTVVDFIKQQFQNIDIIADKSIAGGCSRRRPDIFIDLGYQIVIVEVDENQHITYDCSCENKRIMELSQDVAHRPIVFIRFNPDDYIKNDNKITSCWGMNKQGICVVKPSKKKEWNERLQALEAALAYWIEPSNITNKCIETIQLFYDE